MTTTPTIGHFGALTTRKTCRRCGGTGQFITLVENGVPKGPGGICYRCRGKGSLTSADDRRNDYYDRFVYLSRV